MRDEILSQLRAAMPVDGVLLGLHGAMVAHGYDDCEGDLIARVREIVGEKTVIGVELDPHCHLTEQRVRGADIIILFKEYPHIDFAERAEELVTLVVKAIRGNIRPKMSLYDCRMIDVFPTTREPGIGFVAKMKNLEGRDGVLSVSLGHGFWQGDVPEHGTRVLVVTDNAKDKGDTRSPARSARRCAKSAALGIRHIFRSMPRSMPPMRSRAGRSWSPIRPTMPAGAPPPTTPTSSAACWSAA
jgi:microcystin degradation protein MlrC